MRVTELGGDVEAEIMGILDGAVTKTDADGSTLFEGLLEEEGLQEGVQLLTDVLKKHLEVERL